MDIFSVLTMIGGLALFMFGMQMMGSGLEKASSGKLEQMLKKLTSSKWRGMLLGLVVTAIIQSSSATTVTVVGFVNSGIMQLGQAISVIMGANIGTTVTAWLLSLAGIEGSNIVLQLLKPTSFSPILAAIGVCMMMLSKKSKNKDIGTILASFAVLMYGMDMMSTAMKPLANSPEFANVFLMFENPLLGVLVGALLTGVIQSSSASVGILQALAISGGVTYAAAIPIIMGQNIGTCVTSLISCIGANRNARRAAMVHLYFNIIGTAVFLALYCIVRAVFHPAILATSISAFNIAIVHSLFNLFTTALLSPFTDQLEKLAIMTVREKKTGEETVLLDERLLATPAFALSRCKELTSHMAQVAQDTLKLAIGLLTEYDPKIAKQVEESEEEIDHLEDILGTFLVKLSARSLSDTESREVSKILHCIGDFERISDHAMNLAESAAEIHAKSMVFSAEAQREMTVVTGAVEEIVEIAMQAFQTNDVPLAKWVEPLEEVIDDLIRELKLRHIERLRIGVCTVEMGFVFNDILANFERVADHCSNIAICIIELEQYEMNAHEYLNKMDRQADFQALYQASRRKYAI